MNIFSRKQSPDVAKNTTQLHSAILNLQDQINELTAQLKGSTKTVVKAQKPDRRINYKKHPFEDRRKIMKSKLVVERAERLLEKLKKDMPQYFEKIDRSQIQDDMGLHVTNLIRNLRGTIWAKNDWLKKQENKVSDCPDPDDIDNKNEVHRDEAIKMIFRKADHDLDHLAQTELSRYGWRGWTTQMERWVDLPETMDPMLPDDPPRTRRPLEN